MYSMCCSNAAYKEVLSHLNNLKFVQFPSDFLTELLESLNTVEECALFCDRDNGERIKIASSALACRLSQLSKLHLIGFDEKYEDYHDLFQRINNKRKKLANAQILKVYLEHSYDFTGKKVDYELVHVLHSQTEANTNPFIEHTRWDHIIPNSYFNFNLEF